MPHKRMPSAAPARCISPFTEIDITNDLRAMAVALGDATLYDGEYEWQEDDVSSNTSSSVPTPDAGQIDIRSYFRPLPREDIRVYFRPINPPRLADSRRVHDKPQLSITVPKTKVKASYNIAEQAVMEGPMMSRSCPHPSARTKTRGGRGRDMNEHAIKEQPARTPSGHRKHQHHAAADRAHWHSTWTDEGLHMLAYSGSPKHGEVIDYSMLPRGLKPVPTRYSPTLSEGETLVSSVHSSSPGKEDIEYSVLPALPIRESRNQESSPDRRSRKDRQADHPYSPDDFTGGPTSPYASSEALPCESRPTGASALQLWAEEQRRQQTAVSPGPPPKKSPKRGRQVLRSTKKEQSDVSTKERLEQNRQEDCESWKICRGKSTMTNNSPVILMHPGNKLDIPSFPSSPATHISQQQSVRRAHSSHAQPRLTATGGLSSPVMPPDHRSVSHPRVPAPALPADMPIRRAVSNETLRQGKMVVTELPQRATGAAVGIAVPITPVTPGWKSRRGRSKKEKEPKEPKEKKPNKLKRMMEAYAKNVENMQMVQ